MDHLAQQSIYKEIEELQSKIAFQDMAIETLNQIVINQQFTIDKLQAQFKFMSAKLQGVEPSMMAMPHEETPPPHY